MNEASRWVERASIIDGLCSLGNGDDLFLEESSGTSSSRTRLLIPL